MRSMKRSISLSFCLGVVDDVRRAEGHHRAVVQRMPENRARQHQAVDMAYGQTHRDAAALLAQHAAGRRAVPVEPVALAPEQWVGVT